MNKRVIVDTSDSSGFLRRGAGVSLRERVRSSVISEELGAEPLLLRVDRSRSRRFRLLVRMPPGHLPVEEVQLEGGSGAEPGPGGVGHISALGTLQDPPVRAGVAAAVA